MKWIFTEANKGGPWSWMSSSGEEGHTFSTSRGGFPSLEAAQQNAHVYGYGPDAIAEVRRFQELEPEPEPSVEVGESVLGMEESFIVQEESDQAEPEPAPEPEPEPEPEPAPAVRRRKPPAKKS